MIESEDWPEGRTFGELTPAQKAAAAKRAAAQLQNELQANAEAIGQVLDQSLEDADRVIRWERTPDRSTWRAAAGNLLLTASRLSSGMWSAAVEGPGVVERSERPFGARLAAQRWCENRAGAK